MLFLAHDLLADRWHGQVKKCIDAIALAEILTCAAGGYPDKAPEENTTVVMTVVASIALSGLKVAEFKAAEEAFTSSVAITLSCSIDQITITNVTEVSDQRLLSDSTLPSGLPLGQHGHVYHQYRLVCRVKPILYTDF